ncbi:MAG: 5-methyltetrahydropteroyltriglutamate--homocysteine S-methyltransferase, partial [Candidatus Binataceae bacterium]
MTKTAPFRADHVGSLLRPTELHDARTNAKAGEISAAELKAVEDRCIGEAVAHQEAAGLESITDGELRREYWHLDFLRQLDGVELRKAVGLTFHAGDVPPMATVTSKVGCSRPIFTDHFAVLKSATRKTAKLTIPAPGALHFRGGRNAISRAVYPDLAQF